MKKWIIGALTSSLLAACAGEPSKGPAPIVGASGNAGASGASTAGTATSGIQGSSLSASPLNDPNNILSKRSIYYDFGNADVQDEYKPMIKAHAQYLIAHPAAKVQLQGNCDERGSREYNLALGERRADSVRQLMEASGVPATQISIVSYGSEKPKALGHDEEDWKQNRRTDIVYLNP